MHAHSRTDLLLVMSDTFFCDLKLEFLSSINLRIILQWKMRLVLIFWLSVKKFQMNKDFTQAKLFCCAIEIRNKKIIMQLIVFKQLYDREVKCVMNCHSP